MRGLEISGNEREINQRPNVMGKTLAVFEKKEKKWFPMVLNVVTCVSTMFKLYLNFQHVCTWVLFFLFLFFYFQKSTLKWCSRHWNSTRRSSNKKKKKKKKRIENKEKRSLLDFAVPLEHRVKLKEGEKIDKYLHFVSELEKSSEIWMWLWYQLQLESLERFSEARKRDWGKLEITGKIKTTLTTALLKSARIPRRVLETREDNLSVRLQWKTTSYRLLWKTHSKWKIILNRRHGENFGKNIK